MHGRALSAPLQETLGFALRESTSAIVNQDQGVVGGNSSDRGLLKFLNREALLGPGVVANKENEILFDSHLKFSAKQVSFAAADGDVLFPSSLVSTWVGCATCAAYPLPPLAGR